MDSRLASSLVLILALVAMLDRVTNYHLMAVIGVTNWTSIARLTRGELAGRRRAPGVARARS